MIEKDGKKYYTMDEVSRMTGVHLITVYRRARTRDIDVITQEGKKHVSEDSFGEIERVGLPGRPPKEEVDKRVDIG